MKEGKVAGGRLREGKTRAGMAWGRFYYIFCVNSKHSLHVSRNLTVLQQQNSSLNWSDFVLPFSSRNHQPILQDDSVCRIL
jgi:hypothetical protein